MIPYPLHADIRSSADLTSLYRQYLRVLNNRTFDLMARFVARRCVHNGHRMSAQEYSTLIKPGATFCADEIVADVSQRTIAARLHIEFPASYPGGVRKVRSRTESNGDAREASPTGSATHERHSPTRTTSTPRITRLSEHVFYHFDENWRIDRVWSMVEDVSDQTNMRNSMAVGGDHFPAFGVGRLTSFGRSVPIPHFPP
ncbi:hypothetical protein CC85DRAFT_326207 [Cutaneotrichosporon oleaginosum]|uniref:Uncharacterized protein n=1 Tax=Cutaneotrichosporon oleaginosum TaxID=879819 RepID=A0A0J0XV48_9TREE|nr:uncharacterized protein CC85DRAFT_326207 [Cutaneotrichosporon oleaginosum]KLT44942.1 hypothetical protein CC85DRAFT_326207 [Cutaneotrichosporon oleaginosum]TXT12068.1 hypothetical protein COLE_02478 [Cutaneotrichosporon oleaginosum]